MKKSELFYPFILNFLNDLAIFFFNLRFEEAFFRRSIIVIGLGL